MRSIVMLAVVLAITAAKVTSAQAADWTPFYGNKPLCSAASEHIIFLNTTSYYAGQPLHRQAADFVCYSTSQASNGTKQFDICRYNGTTAEKLWCETVPAIGGLPDLVKRVQYRSMYLEFLLVGGTVISLNTGEVQMRMPNFASSCSSSSSGQVLVDEYPWPGGSNPGLAVFVVTCRQSTTTTKKRFHIEIWSAWNPVMLCSQNITFSDSASAASNIVSHTLTVVTDRSVHAIDTESCAVLWSKQVITSSSSSTSQHLAAVDQSLQGVIMARVDDSTDSKSSQLHAFGARTGEVAFPPIETALGSNVVSLGTIYNPPEQNDNIFFVADTLGRLCKYDKSGNRVEVAIERHSLLPEQVGAFVGVVARQKVGRVAEEEVLWAKWADAVCWSEFWCLPITQPQKMELLVPKVTSSLAFAFLNDRVQKTVALLPGGGAASQAATKLPVPGDVFDVAAVMRDGSVVVQFATTAGVVAFKRAL